MIRYIIFSAIVFLTAGAVCAQDVQFNYDNNGNRTSQEVITLKTELSNATGISSTDTVNRKILIGKAAIDIAIFPNPVERTLNIEISGNIPEKVKRIEISSLNGASIYYDETPVPKTRIDFAAFKPGIYFLTITISNSVNTWKIIKSN